MVTYYLSENDMHMCIYIIVLLKFWLINMQQFILKVIKSKMLYIMKSILAIVLHRIISLGFVEIFPTLTYCWKWLVCLFRLKHLLAFLFPEVTEVYVRTVLARY